MRIVSIGEPSTCREYRSIAPMQGLVGLGHDFRYVEPVGDTQIPSTSVEELTSADVILGYRMLHADLPLVRAALARGVAFVWDTDDDLANMPKESSTFKSHGAKGIQRIAAQSAQLARMADVVTTTTTVLASKWSNAGAKQTIVIPNFLREGVARRIERPRREQVVIGWVAAAEHKADMRRVPIVKALRALLADYPQVRVESAGVQLPLPGDRYSHYSWVLVGRLPSLFAQWDVGIAPLSDIPFNRARSDVKLKEYAATGLPWAASPVGPYADKLEEHGGWLVPDGEWYDALAELVEEPQTRDELGRFGARWAATQTATLPENARRWEQACQAALNRRAARPPTA